MSSLTKPELRAHRKAEELLERSSEEHGYELTGEDVEHVLNYWRPSASRVPSVKSTYFTPLSVAWELAVMASAGEDNVHYLDLCAGIGALSWGLLKHEYRHDVQITAVEAVEEFVDIGRRVLPQVDWKCGDAFNKKFVESITPKGGFDIVVSNPPFAMMADEYSWLESNTKHFAAVEVAVSVSDFAVFIMPEGDLPFKWSGYYLEEVEPSNRLRNFQEANPDIGILPASVDISFHKDDWHHIRPNVGIAIFNRKKVIGGRNKSDKGNESNTYQMSLVKDGMLFQ